MPTTLVRLLLFLCSYSPLTLIICILQYGIWWLWVVIVLGVVVCVCSVAFTGFFFAWKRRTEQVRTKRLQEFSSHDSEVMSYIASYLIPFVTFSLDGVKQVFTLLIFIGVLAVIYVRSNMIYINPMLSLAGYHLYEIKIEGSENPHYYIARKTLERNRDICFVRLSDDIYLEK